MHIHTFRKHFTFICRRVFPVSILKRGLHKQIKFCSFKHHTVDLFEQELSELNFTRYHHYNSFNEAYNDFIQKIMNVIDKITPMKKDRQNKTLKNDFIEKLPMK